jgi:SWI/SNF-related matrix-associated actin-dependent regulator of chromatin subfamily A3
MGLGKTLSVISLLAATRKSALQWSHTEPEPESPGKIELKSEIDPNEMKTKVYGMPDIDTDDKSALKRKREEPPKSLVKRTKATLLVCPMSTITNWEDQIKGMDRSR